jgi:hypothetical protein
MSMNIDWKAAVAALLVWAVVLVLLWAAFGWHRMNASDAFGVEPTPGVGGEPDEEDDFDRPTNPAALASGQQVDRSRESVLAVFDTPRAEPVQRAPLGLAGRMFAAVMRLLKAPTRETTVVPVAAEPSEPFDPLTSPMNIEPVEPVDTWALTPTPPRDWADKSFTEQWLALTPERLAEIAAQRELDKQRSRHYDARVLSDATQATPEHAEVSA